MPIHIIDRADVREAVAALEAEGEIVAQVLVDPDDVHRLLVFTHHGRMSTQLTTRTRSYSGGVGR